MKLDEKIARHLSILITQLVQQLQTKTSSHPLRNSANLRNACEEIRFCTYLHAPKAQKRGKKKAFVSLNKRERTRTLEVLLKKHRLNAL